MESYSYFIVRRIAHLVNALRVVDVTHITLLDGAVASQLERLGFVSIGEGKTTFTEIALQHFNPARRTSVIMNRRALTLVPAKEEHSEGSVVGDKVTSVLLAVEASEVIPLLLVDFESSEHITDGGDLVVGVRERLASEGVLEAEEEVADGGIDTSVESRFLRGGQWVWCRFWLRGRRRLGR